MGNIIIQFPDYAGAIAYEYVLSEGIIIASICITTTILVLFYVLRGIGLYSLAKRSGYSNAFLAWIPYCWMYLCGKLAGEVSVFGKKFKKFYIFAFLVVLTDGLLSIASAVLVYVPLASWVLHGNDVYLLSIRTITYPVFTSGIQTAYSVIGYTQSAVSIIEIFAVITVFFNFFKKYWPQHFTLASILGFFGLFPIFAFVVRKNDPVNYQDWIRERYRAFFMNVQNPYGNPNTDTKDSAGGKQDSQSPFEDYKENKNEDPFSDFPDDKENK